MEENMVNNGLNEGEVNSEKESGEKLFTQEQVNEIVKKRLGRQKEENANIQELEARAAQLTERENRLSCREYLLDKGYPVELLEIIDTSDVSKFMEKADKSNQLFGGMNQEVAPLASTERVSGSADKFPDTTHVPKGYWATDPSTRSR